MICSIAINFMLEGATISVAECESGRDSSEQSLHVSDLFKQKSPQKTFWWQIFCSRCPCWWPWLPIMSFQFADFFLLMWNQERRSAIWSVPKRNPSGRYRNLACKFPICLSKNPRRKRFDGHSFALAAPVDGPDCTSWALELLIFLFLSAFRSSRFRFESDEIACLRRRMPIESHRLRVCRRKIACFLLVFRVFGWFYVEI